MTATITKCELCETAPASLIKTEADYSWDDEQGAEVVTAVDLAICGVCADDWYDGTEDFPGTRPLV